MDALLMMLVCGGGFLIAYHTYGRFLGKKIFRLKHDAQVPSKELADGIDYVPTKRGIIFGHHYTSIAGTGPIVGPAIGIIWGWLPAILWVVFGSIFMGAVHDFGSLVVSMRNEGKSISEVAAKYINPRVRFIFFVVVFLTLLIVIAVFGVVIAVVFDRFPSSVVPVWLQIPIAVGLGYAIYKKSASIPLATTVAVICMYATITIGSYMPINIPASISETTALELTQAKEPVPAEVVNKLEPIKGQKFVFVNDFEDKVKGLLDEAQFKQYGGKILNAGRNTGLFGLKTTGMWTIILLIYAWIASTLPVTTLLQPRDYINAWQLFIMMAMLCVGIVFASFGSAMPLVAPAINPAIGQANSDIPSMWPLMFVTIACGAISGFHSLVASGTSPKQVATEPDSLFIGYGSMLLEGFLAVLVLICVGAGIGLTYETVGGEVLKGTDAWNLHYASWDGAKGLGAKLSAVVIGAANMVKTAKLPETVGKTLMGVFIASFAGTTLDTAVRIQRYVVSELASDLKIKPLTNRWTATTFAVLTAAALAFTAGANGKGAMKLWPLFGAVNQLLAALALLVVTMYLRKKGGSRYVFAAIPCLIMLTITNWAMIKNEMKFIEEGNHLLIVIGAGIFVLALWMTVETVITFFNAKITQTAQAVS